MLPEIHHGKLTEELLIELVQFKLITIPKSSSLMNHRNNLYHEDIHRREANVLRKHIKKTLLYFKKSVLEKTEA